MILTFESQTVQTSTLSLYLVFPCIEDNVYVILKKIN